MGEPEPLSSDAALKKIQNILNQRGMGNTPTGAIDDPPTPDEPGHPDYHHRKRVEAALAKLGEVAPKRYRAATTDIPDVVNWASQVAASPDDAPSLLLWGPVGTGKTHAAYGAARRIAESGITRFGFVPVTTVDLFASQRPGNSEDERRKVMDRVLRYPLVLLDDLGAARDTDWTEEIVYRVLNHRDNEQLPTIITTNLTPQGIKDECSDRVASRLMGMCARVHVDGDDLRYR